MIDSDFSDERGGADRRANWMFLGSDTPGVPGFDRGIRAFLLIAFFAAAILAVQTALTWQGDASTDQSLRTDENRAIAQILGNTE